MDLEYKGNRHQNFRKCAKQEGNQANDIMQSCKHIKDEKKAIGISGCQKKLTLRWVEIVKRASKEQSET